MKKIAIAQSITLHHGLLKSKAEIDQFMKGLEVLGTLNKMRKATQMFRDFFVVSEKRKLTAGQC